MAEPKPMHRHAPNVACVGAYKDAFRINSLNTVSNTVYRGECLIDARLLCVIYQVVRCALYAYTYLYEYTLDNSALFWYSRTRSSSRARSHYHAPVYKPISTFTYIIMCV